ncbi:MAG TPA: RraA family protein [Deltaproteobacteria bacterium]|nr:RraA family protein [Deltaproteobacteria bacterium]HOM28766.1 RraA family protein [Deltaproteobacteria bacterium]HPP80742.1 RraA family protein [Deltaproteobacteria bacterium]
MDSHEWKEKIIDYIKRNRVSSTEVADCLGKTGAVPDVRPISEGHFRVGNVFWAYAYGESNWDVHERLQHVQEGDVALVEVFDCKDRAVFGDLVSKFLILYRQVSAIVVRGYLRDAHRLIKERWPIWCTGFNPVGCFNQKVDTPFDRDTFEDRLRRYHGAIGVCDDTGVVIIPKEHHTEEFFHKLEFIEQQEDIWYECIDRRKWTTFETVCLKKYADKA